MSKCLNNFMNNVMACSCSNGMRLFGSGPKQALRWNAGAIKDSIVGEERLVQHLLLELAHQPSFTGVCFVLFYNLICAHITIQPAVHGELMHVGPWGFDSHPVYCVHDTTKSASCVGILQLLLQ